MPVTITSFRPGSAHRKWKGGVGLNDKGYRRISHGSHRGKYEHRRVMEKLLEAPLCAGYVFPKQGVIPEGLTVEHIDHNRTHNCQANLMLLDAAIHNAITWAGCRYIREHYAEYLAHVTALNYEESLPDWAKEA